MSNLETFAAGRQSADQVETTPTGASTKSVTAITPTEIIPPSGTLGTSGNFPFVETDYEPHPDVTPDEVAKLPDNDLLTGLKKQHRKTRQEMEVYLLYYEEAVRRFDVEQPRSDGGQFERKDKPLVKAFDAIGRHYETERKRAWRYRQALQTRLRMSSGSGSPKLKEWDFVQDANSVEQIIVGKPTLGHVEVVPIDGTLEDAQVVPTNSLNRVPVTTISLNHLILCDDNGKRYKYVGNGNLKCMETPKLIKQVQDRDAAALKAQQQQVNKDAQAAMEAKAERNKLRKAEDCRKALDLITEKPDGSKTKAQLEAEANQKAAKPKVARTQKPAKPEKTKTKAELEAEKKNAESKAMQEVQDRARRAEIEASTNALVARLGYDKSGYIGKQDADGDQVGQ